jgi:hypothetical protein
VTREEKPRPVRPRLFGKDPSKEIVVVPWPLDKPKPEFAMNSGVDDYAPPASQGKCIDCGGFGSLGFVFGSSAGRAPCKRCDGTGDEPR